jgi:four helix bundle protein
MSPQGRVLLLKCPRVDPLDDLPDLPREVISWHLLFEASEQRIALSNLARSKPWSGIWWRYPSTFVAFGDRQQTVVHSPRSHARSSVSIILNNPLNVAEGRSRAGRDRTHLFRIAAGSASEVAAALDVAQAFGYLSSELCEPSRKLLDRQRALLWGLTHPRR